MIQVRRCELGGHYVRGNEPGEEVTVQLNGEKYIVWACRRCLVGMSMLTEELPATAQDGHAQEMITD